MGNKTVFAQIMDVVPWRRFQTIINKYHGDMETTQLKTHVYFRIMAFSQLTARRSLRDTVSCLNAMKPKLFHMGIRAVSLNNVANASAKRDWRIFAELGYLLIAEAKKLYANDTWDVDVDSSVFALDSTTIDLCLSLFNWAYFRETKSAVKVHALLNVKSEIPEFIRISTGKVHDVPILDELNFSGKSWYVMDKGYNDFGRLHRIEEAKAFFVIRAKKNTQMARLYSHPVDKSTGLRCDQTVRFVIERTRCLYPDKIRRIKFYDEEHDRRVVFLTNNITLPALTITTLYKKRWEVELFFKWIKQHLRIKRFFGQSENAVRIQIWVAIAVYLLVAIERKRLAIDRPMSEILTILKGVPFENMPVFKLFCENYDIQTNNDSSKGPFLPGFLMGH
ncbi:MAG: IS4 family transposase [Planctomycetia bacterium]|nr:IS4 family transposase [Planctomycetia bacterium]